jgi:hypothetical protein
LAGALLFDEIIHQSACTLVDPNQKRAAALFWFGLRNDVILYLRAETQRTIDISPVFLEHGSAKKIAV